MPQNREKVHLDRHKTLTGPLRLLNGVSPGANCPFDGRHQSILGFPMCFKERLLCCWVYPNHGIANSLIACSSDYRAQAAPPRWSRYTGFWWNRIAFAS